MSAAVEAPNVVLNSESLPVLYLATVTSILDHLNPVCYPHMPIGMLGIYRLLFFRHFVRRILVIDIWGLGWRRAMKFCWLVDLVVYQVISTLVNFG